MTGCVIRNDLPGGKAWTALKLLNGRNNVFETAPPEGH